MANVTAAMVKELRDATGAGMMDCKKALVAANGDMQAAIDAMRKSGAAKAAKKAGRIAAEGIITIARDGNKIAMVETNTETDFAAKNAEFQAFAKHAAEVALATASNDIEAVKAADFGNGETTATALTNLIAKIGENMTLRRVVFVDAGADATVGVYLHSNNKIGVITVLKGGDEALAKDVAMHVCAMKPEFVKPEDVAADVVEHERQLQIDLAVQSGKPKEIAEKMVEGRMRKFTGEISLTGQPFVRDPNVTVGQMLKEQGADAVTFKRLEVGEGVEKKQEDFAAEVQAQIADAKK